GRAGGAVRVRRRGRRTDGAARAPRSLPGAQPHLLGALPAGLQVRRRPLRWPSAPARAGPRLAPPAMTPTTKTTSADSAPGAPARSPEKQQRLANVYDAEVLPIYARRFAQMALRAL